LSGIGYEVLKVLKIADLNYIFDFFLDAFHLVWRINELKKCALNEDGPVQTTPEPIIF
jgi:hypothetical protein